MQAGARSSATRVTASTINVYVGANVDGVISALANGDPSDDLLELLHAIATLQATAFPERAKALAREIDRSRPHFVGLQELSEIDIDLPPLGIDVSFNYLAILQGELAARGLNYVVAAKVANIDVALVPVPGSHVRLTDHDAILVDANRVDVVPGSATANRFSTNIGDVAPGVSIVRGWVGISARVEGRTMLVVNTHLESGNSSPVLAQVRAAQALELATSTAGRPNVIVMGDMNDVPGSPMHDVFTGSGFQDVWQRIRPNQLGHTCCHLPDLSNTSGLHQLTQRIDYVFARGALEKNDGLFGRAALFGAVLNDRLSGPDYTIWPSDHTGLTVDLYFSGSD